MPVLPKVHLSVLSITINTNRDRLEVMPPNCKFGNCMEKVRVKYKGLIAV